MIKKQKISYISKILGLSLVWHGIWFFSIDAVISPQTAIKKTQEIVFLGSLLSSFDLKPKIEKGKGPEGLNKTTVREILQDKITIDNVSGLINLTQKRPVWIKDNITPRIIITNPLEETHKVKDNVIEISFNIAPRDSNFYPYSKPLAGTCEFRLVTKNDSLWIQRLTSTGDPNLDLNIRGYVEEELLYLPADVNDRIRVRF